MYSPKPFVSAIGPTSKLTWKTKFHSIRNCKTGWQSTRALSEGSGGIYPQVSPAWRPTASDTGWYSGWDSLKNRPRRQWQITRDPALKAEVNRLQRSVTLCLKEWSHDQWGATPESLDPEDHSLWRITKRVMRVPTPSPTWSPRGESLSQTLRKSKPLPTIWRLSFSRWQIARSRQLLRWLTWRWDLTSWTLSVNPCWPTLRSFKKPSGVSNSARLRARTVSRRGPFCIYYSERYPSWFRFSTRSSSPITSLHPGSTLEWSLYLNRGRIQHCPHPIGPLVSWSRLVNYLKRSY